jgi:hypothetical protein
MFALIAPGAESHAGLLGVGLAWVAWTLGATSLELRREDANVVAIAYGSTLGPEAVVGVWAADEPAPAWG